MMSAPGDTGIRRESSTSNPLHRLKLRRAIQEMVAPRNLILPAALQLTLTNGQMNHERTDNEWPPSPCLLQHPTPFVECLVDAKML